MKRKTLIIAFALLMGSIFSSALKAGQPCKTKTAKCTKQVTKKIESKTGHEFMPGVLVYHFL
jgi:hypothetical protein